MPCNGPDGCVLRDGKAICDARQAQAGDFCSVSDKDKKDACSMDGTKLLTCTDNKWTAAYDCTGPDKCKVEGDKGICDQSIASVDAPCIGEARACSTDGTKALDCKDGKFVVAFECGGVNKCQMKGNERHCDQSNASVDAPCIGEARACSTDGTKALDCKDGKFVVAFECRGANKCQIKENNRYCDQTLGNVDEACLSEEGYACSVDGTKLLKCTGGKYVVDEDCASASATCVLQDGGAGCKSPS